MKKHLPTKLLIAVLFIVSFFSTAYAQTDTLYVGSYNTDQIFRFDQNGNVLQPEPWLGPYGNSGNTANVQGEGIAVGQDYPTTGGYAFGDISNPVYIANDYTGDIEVANANTTGTNNPVVNSTFITGLNVPADIALSNNGQDLYVASQGAGTIAAYNALTGAFITSVSLYDAHDVAVNAAGDVFVTAFAAGSTNSPVGVNEYSPSLTFITNFLPVSTTVGPGLLSRPTGMVFDSSGDLWVANVYAPNGNVNTGSVSTSDFVSEYSPTGTLLHTYEASGNMLYVVFGLSIGPNGNIYAASFEGNQITEIDPTTGVVSTFIGTFPTSTDEPKYAIWGSDAVTFSSVPEPKTYGMMTLGGLALLLAFRFLRRTLRTDPGDPGPVGIAPRLIRCRQNG